MTILYQKNQPFFHKQRMKIGVLAYNKYVSLTQRIYLSLLAMHQPDPSFHSVLRTNSLNEAAAEVVKDHQAEIDLLDGHSKQMIGQLLDQICAKLSQEVCALWTQINDLSQQKLMLAQRIESYQVELSAMEQQNQMLRINFQAIMQKHNECTEELDISKSQLHQQKRNIIEQSNYYQSLENDIKNYQEAIERLEEENGSIKELYEKEKERNSQLYHNNIMLDQQYRQLNIQFEKSIAKNQELSSNLSQNDQEIKALKKILQDKDFIQTVVPQIERNELLNISLEHKKTLKEEQPNIIRLSQSEDPLILPPLPIKSMKKSTEYKTKRESSKPNTTSQKKLMTCKPDKMVSVKHDKKISSSQSKQEDNISKRSNKDKSQKMAMKEKLKQIFLDRVKYKIENDLRHHHQVDSLRCRLRAKENEKNKLERQLRQLKKNTNGSTNSAVLGRKSQKAKSRKFSRNDSNQLWLQGELKDSMKKGDPALNNSYEQLLQQKQQLQSSPRGKFQAEQKQRSSSDLRIDSRRFDQFEEFNLNEHNLEHHYLNSQLDIREDISFKNSQHNNNQSNSLSQYFSKRKRCLSLYSQQGSQIFLYKDGQIQTQNIPIHETTTPHEHSPALMRVLIQGQMEQDSAVMQLQADHGLKESPYSRFQPDQILISSYANTDRTVCRVSEFQMFYQQPHSQNLRHISLGCIACVRNKTRKLAIMKDNISQCIKMQKNLSICSLAIQNQVVLIQAGPKKCDGSSQTVHLQAVEEDNCGHNSMKDKKDSQHSSESRSCDELNQGTTKYSMLRNQKQTIKQKQQNTKINKIVVQKSTNTEKESRSDIASQTENSHQSFSQTSIQTQGTEPLQKQTFNKSVAEAWTNTEELERVEIETSIDNLDTKAQSTQPLSYANSQTSTSYEEMLHLNLRRQFCCSTIANKQQDIGLSTDIYSMIDYGCGTVSPKLKIQPVISQGIEPTIKKELGLVSGLNEVALELKAEKKVCLISAFSLVIDGSLAEKKKLHISKLGSLKIQGMKLSRQLILQSFEIFDQAPHKEAKELKRCIDSSCLNWKIEPQSVVDLSDSISQFESAESWHSLTQETNNVDQFTPEDLSALLEVEQQSSGEVLSQSEKLESSEYENQASYSSSLQHTIVSKLNNDKECQQIYKNNQRSNNSSRVSDFKLVTPNLCSKLSSPQIQKSILSDIDLQLTMHEEDLLKTYFSNISSLRIKDTGYSKSSQNFLEFDDLQLIYCLREDQGYQLALWKGKLLMVSPSVYFMQLPALKRSSIKHQNGHLLMGNCQVTITPYKLTVNRSRKVKFFRGDMPEGQWKITQVKVYKVIQTQ